LLGFIEKTESPFSDSIKFEEKTNFMENNTSPKSIAIISYITIIGWILAVVMNSKNRTSIANFHIRQALGIHLLFMLSRMIAFVTGSFLMSKIIFVAAFALLIIGLLSASKEEEKPIPVVGEAFQEWFKSV